MPLLPLNHTEPFAATLGVMLYPGLDGRDQRSALAFVTRWLAVPLSRYHKAGHRLTYEALSRIFEAGGEPLDDLDDRCWGAMATGELFKTLWALFNTDHNLTSWNNAIRIAEFVAQRNKTKGSRTEQWAARRRFLNVAHLWGAWSIRQGKFGGRPDVGYDGFDDFQMYLAEAEILRDWGQTWQPPRAKSKPLLPKEVWCAPEGWAPSERQINWPNTGMIPVISLPDDFVASLNKPGRPRNAA